MSEIQSLVSTDWLENNLLDPNIKIVDATWHLPNSERKAEEEYKKNHIPGAIFFDIDEIANLEMPLPHMMPNDEKMASRVRSLGISNSNHVIVYDNSDFSSAARVWFMFKNFGHKNVSILDGGFQKWQQENKPANDQIKKPSPSHFRAQLNKERIRDIDDVKDNINSRHEQLVDARSSGRFKGTAPEPRPDSKSGHIPGSFNVPFNDLINENKTYKSRSEIKEIFHKNGVDLAKPIITSCGSGVTACVLIFALHLIGHDQSALYDGSWSEWGTRADTPIEI